MKFICYFSAFYLLAAFEPCPTAGQAESDPTPPPEQLRKGLTIAVADATIRSSKARFPVATSMAQGVNLAPLERLSDLVKGFCRSGQDCGGGETASDQEPTHHPA